MKAKKYLQRIYQINLLIKSLEDELLVLETIAQGGAIGYSEKVQTSNINSYASTVCKIAQMKCDINDLIKEKLILIEEISIKICLIEDNEEQAILRKRYINCETWEKIAKDTKSSISKVYTIHRIALKNFQYILEKCVVNCS